MGLETAEFIDGLITTNPLSTDLKTQGDDHMRLIKLVLQNTFPRAAKAYPFPDMIEVSDDYDILDTDQNMIIEADAGGGSLVLVPPSLNTGDAGWWVFVCRTGGGTSPVFIDPATGTVNGFNRIRRSVNNQLTLLMWTGNQWIASRPAGMPIGSVVQFDTRVAIPNNFLLANGSSFSGTNYPELQSVLGSTTTQNIASRYYVVE